MCWMENGENGSSPRTVNSNVWFMWFIPLKFKITKKTWTKTRSGQICEFILCRIIAGASLGVSASSLAVGHLFLSPHRLLLFHLWTTWHYVISAYHVRTFDHAASLYQLGDKVCLKDGLWAGLNPWADWDVSFGVSQTRIFRIPREWHSFTIRGRVRLTLLNLIELRQVWELDNKERLPAAGWFAESFVPSIAMSVLSFEDSPAFDVLRG